MIDGFSLDKPCENVVIAYSFNVELCIGNLYSDIQDG